MRIWIGPHGLGGDAGVGTERALPAGAARHLQVLRAQPGDRVECFDGTGAAWTATVVSMARQAVVVRLDAPAPAAVSELTFSVELAVVMPANDRMDFLVEKATELGVAALQPLVARRSVLRLDGERAERKVAHWQAVAVAAAEQCGRRVVPVVRPVRSLDAWLSAAGPDPGPDPGPKPDADADADGTDGPVRSRWLLGFDADAVPAAGTVPATGGHACLLSGPEGGLSPDEVAAARARGFRPVTLGPRVLRADTAPLAWLAHAAVSAGG